MICGSGGSKSRLTKAAGAEPCGQMRDEWKVARRWVVAQSTFPSQNAQSTPGSEHFLKLRCRKSARRWHLQVKKLKAPQLRNAFRSCDVEKMHAVVARSTCRSQNVQDTSASEHFWKLRCSKSVRRCGAKHISKSKCTKHHMFVPLLDVEASFCVAGARASPPCQKWAKHEGFVAVSRTMAGVGHLKRIWKDAYRISRGGRSTRDMFIGRWFPERGCILASDLQFCWDYFAWQVQHFVWPGITFSWQAQ